MTKLWGNLYRPVLLALTMCWASCGGTVQHESGGSAGHAGSIAGSANSAGESGHGLDEAGASGSAGAAGAAGSAAGVGGEGGAAGEPSCIYSDGLEENGPNCWAMCGRESFDFWNDYEHCGGCHHHCKTGEKCAEEKCVVEECPINNASCTRPGCETSLSSPDNCGACGVVAAPPGEHAIALCGCAGECDHGICAPGYANCDAANDDCETSLATGGACVPKPSWFCVPGGLFSNANVAIAPDGTLYIANGFKGDVDFDPTSAVDLHTSGGTYLSKFNADGSYAWTRTWPSQYMIGSFFIHGIQPGPNGSVAVFGEVVEGGAVTKVPFDLDPGPEVDLHRASIALVKFDSSGSYAWGRSWGGNTPPTIANVAFDDAGRVYVAGQFFGRMDADPGPGSTRRGIGGENYADLLLSLDEQGDYRWSGSFTDARCTSVLNAMVVKGNQLWAGGSVSGCEGKTNPVVELPTLSKQFGVNPATPFLIKTDLEGNVERALSFPNEFRAEIYGVAVDSTNQLYLAFGQSGAVDFDPGPGVEPRTGPGSVVALSEDWNFRWVVSGASVGGVLSLLPGNQLLASNVALDHSGTAIFTLDPSSWDYNRFRSSSSDAGVALIGQNKTKCPDAFEIERYAW